MRVPAFLAVILLSGALFAYGPDDRHKQELARDMEIGLQVSKEVETLLTLSTDEAKIARVQRIGAEIAVIANSRAFGATYGDNRHNVFEYSFKVLEDKDVNAFSLPGGFIYVYSGLLDFCESDDELAAVLAHEIAHAAHRHLATLMKEQSKLDVWTLPILLGAILSGRAEVGAALITRELVMTAVTSGWTQKAELDADRAGFLYMLETDYHPVALLTFMERLAFRERMGPNIDWGIHRTHPPSRDRARNLEAMLREEGLPIARSLVTTSYRVTAQAVEGEVVVRFGREELFRLRGDGAEERSLSAVENLNRFFDSSPQMFAVRTDRNRLLWMTRPMVEFAPEDAPGATPEAAAEAAAANIKRALFSLGFRTGS